jgi:hypothetical protein
VHPRRDLVIGIVAGVALGIGAVILFLFLESRSAIDEPSIAGRGLTITTPKLQRRAPRRAHVTTVRVKGGGPAGKIPDIRAHIGKRVRFRVTSDSAITIAVEGLGVSGDVPAGGTRELSVVPRRTGEFPVLVAASDIGVARLIVR